MHLGRGVLFGADPQRAIDIGAGHLELIEQPLLRQLGHLHLQQILELLNICPHLLGYLGWTLDNLVLCARLVPHVLGEPLPECIVILEGLFNEYGFELYVAGVKLHDLAQTVIRHLAHLEVSEQLVLLVEEL